MIVGAGMIATELKRYFPVIHAAGVSDSTCKDEKEFARDREMVLRSIESGGVIYLSTCSVHGERTPYVQHKLDMEHLVRESGGAVIRLPIVAGRSDKPHFLLNTLHRKILSGETIQVWINAKRNVIDVSDVARITHSLMHEGIWGRTINIAADKSHYVAEIIAAFEAVTGKRANTELVDKGDSYDIDISGIRHLIKFPEDYLRRVIRRYYG